MRLACLGIVVLISALSAPSLAGDDVAAAAARERERRAKAKAAGATKSYGNDELGTLGELANDPSIPPAAGKAPPPRTSGGPVAGGLPSIRPVSGAAQNEAQWRSRAQQLRSAVTTAEANLKKAEAEAVAAGPLPLGDYEVKCRKVRYRMPDGSLSAPVDPCAHTGAAYNRSVGAKTRVEAAQQALDKARQALANLEEEARRAGAQPGWIR